MSIGQRQNTEQHKTMQAQSSIKKLIPIYSFFLWHNSLFWCPTKGHELHKGHCQLETLIDRFQIFRRVHNVLHQQNKLVQQSAILMNVHSPNKTAECNLQIYGYDILQPALYVCDSINCGTTTRLISHLWPKKPLSKKNPLFVFHQLPVRSLY